MSFRISFTEEAREDLHRLYDFLLGMAEGDSRQADAALEELRRGFALLETSPFACRRAPCTDPMLRELLVGFGETGYVALFEVKDAQTVIILAVRHQREDDYR